MAIDFDKMKNSALQRDKNKMKRSQAAKQPLENKSGSTAKGKGVMPTYVDKLNNMTKNNYFPSKARLGIKPTQVQKANSQNKAAQKAKVKAEKEKAVQRLANTNKYTPNDASIIQTASMMPGGMQGQIYRNFGIDKKVAENTEASLNVNAGKFGFMEGFSPVSTKKQLEKSLNQKLDTSRAENSGTYKAGYMGGLMGQYALTGGLAHGAAKAGVTKAIPKLAGSKVGRGVASVTADALTGVPVNLIDSTKNAFDENDKFKVKEFGKNMAINTALDVGFGAGMEGVAAAVKKGGTMPTAPKAERIPVVGADGKIRYERQVASVKPMKKESAIEALNRSNNANRMTMSEFRDSNSEAYTMIDYNNKPARSRINKQVAERIPVVGSDGKIRYERQVATVNPIEGESAIQALKRSNANRTSYIKREAVPNEYKASYEDYLSATDESVKKFVERSRSGEINRKAFKDLSVANEREVSDVGRIIGIDITGYKHRLKSSTVVDHIDRRHGTKGKADKSMSDINDFARIDYVMREADIIEPLYNKDGSPAVSKEFLNSDGSGAVEIKYTKRINGHYYVAVAVPDNRAKALQVVSAYIEKVGEKPTNSADHLVLMAKDPTPPTSETSDGIVQSTTAINNSIPNPTNIVNEDFLGEAIWKNVDHDQPVKVIGYAGGLNGRKYVNVEGSNTAIPIDEVKYKSVASEDRDLQVLNTPEDDNIIMKLKKNINILKDVSVAANLTGNEFAKGQKKLTEQVGEFFRSLGNRVSREGFGDVIIDNRGIRDSIAHGIGRSKSIAFAAVPDVIRTGKVIDNQFNWKNRGYNTTLFAAPVRIGENISYIGVVVIKEPNSTRYYLHEVVDQSGNIIYKQKETKSFKTGSGIADGLPGDLVSNNSIFNTGSIVKSDFPDDTYKLSGKATRYQKRQENLFLNNISEMLGVSKYADRAGLKGDINIAVEKLKTGNFTEQDKTELFENIYNSGIVSMTKFYDEYKPVKDNIRNTTLKINDSVKNEIPDFEQFRKSNFGVLKLGKDGSSIDVFYDELMDAYPGLFNDVNTQGEMLSEISNVAKSIKKTEVDLNSHMGEGAAEFKSYAREEFGKQLEKLRVEAKVINSYAADRKVKDVFEEVSEVEIKHIYEMAAPIKKNIEKLQNSILLTERDRVQVDRLLKGEITEQEISKGVNAPGVIKMYHAKKVLDDLMKPIEDYNKRYKKSLRDNADELLANSDDWKDKKSPFLYSRETQERNFVDIAGKEDGEALLKEYIEPVHINEANSTRMKNAYRGRVEKLNLGNKEVYNTSSLPSDIFSPSMKKGLISERALVQMYGEGKITDDQLKHIGANVGKIKSSVKEMRVIYNELIEKANDTHMRNGYAPIEYRQDYFPHFENDIPDTVLGKIAKKLGFDVIQDELPTDIAGLTHMFRPGKSWFGNALRRKGDSTVFDAVQGFDRYIEGISDVIHHTDDIQRLRAFENSVRYKYSNPGLKEQIDEILNSNMTDSVKQAEINDLYDVSKSQLANFAQNIRAYTDNLAGKKSMADRSWEQNIFGRGLYNTAKRLENKVAANMVAINPASWLTNFIPLFQGTEVSTKATMKALSRTMRNMVNDDGFRDISNFLTNRAGSEALSKTKTEVAVNWLSSPMRVIDRFTSEVLSRAKYYDEIANGRTSEEAVLSADKFAASVIADRSKGALPNLFNSKNPFNKLFTMFQVEVNNQYSYLFKDLPRNLQDKGMAALTIALTQYVVGAYIYNSVYEHFIGRRPAFDPLGMFESGIEKATGKTILGEDTGEEPSVSKAIMEMGKEGVENIPFVGGLLGGGRIPINSAIPNVPKLVKSVAGYASGEANKDKARQDMINEIVKPAYYFLPPAGGGQLKKAVETFNVMKGGGDYVYDNEGNIKMRFPTDVKAETIAQSAVFGKYSLPTAREYVDSGFKTINKEATAGWKELRKNGVTAAEFMDTYKSIKGITGDKDENGETVKYSKANNIRLEIDKRYPDLSLEKKIPLYDAFKVSEKVYNTEPELVGLSDKKVNLYNDNFKGKGMSAISYLKLVNSMDTDKNGGIKKEEVKAALDKSNLTGEQKAQFWDAYNESWKKTNPYKLSENAKAVKDKYLKDVPDDQLLGLINSMDSNGNMKVSQDEAINYLSGMSYSAETKGILWNAATGGKPSSNPYIKHLQEYNLNLKGKSLLDIERQVIKDESYVSSPYGNSNGRSGHIGTDYGTNRKKVPAYSPEDAGEGKVVNAGFNPTYGNFIEVEYPEIGYRTTLKHLDRYDYLKGEVVPAGSQLGVVGGTGTDSTGVHLHIEWRDMK